MPLLICRYLISKGIRVIAMDLDLVFSRNPFLLLMDESLSGLDFFVQSEHASHEIAQKEGDVNTGFYCLAPTNAAKRFVEIWLKDLNFWEQEIAGKLLKDQAVPDLRWAALPSSSVLSTCHFTAPVHGENIDLNADSYALTFERFLLHHSELLRSITLIHFNCVGVSRDHKIPLTALTLHHIVLARQSQI
jgi:hypothetical protein